MPRRPARNTLPVALAAAVALTAFTGRAEAQFGYGIGFGFGMPMAPSPTQFLYDRAVNATGNTSARQQANNNWRSSPNAYFNNIRDNSGANTFDVSTRRSLSDRVGHTAPAPRPAPAPAVPTVPARSRVMEIDAFFLPDGTFDWPADAPSSGALGSDRRGAEEAIATVRSEIKAGGKASPPSVGVAKWKVIAYGQAALKDVRAKRSPALADVFHYYLLFLNDTLDALGPTPPAS